MIDLTGGPRAFAREGVHLEEETNWRRVELLAASRLISNRETAYHLGAVSDVPIDAFDRGVVRLRTNDDALRSFVAGADTTGELAMPLLTMHSTGDGQVPVDQARILRRRVDAAGNDDLLVQWVLRDPSHCGFNTREIARGFEALVDWVEHGKKPRGTDVLAGLRDLPGDFETNPRPGTPGAGRVPGARDRVVFRGRATLDGAPFDARFLGAVVLDHGLATPCQYTLPVVRRGEYEITVLAASEAGGCGRRGARVVLWTFARDQQLYSVQTVRWPPDERAVEFDPAFSTSAAAGAAPEMVQFAGEVVRRDGTILPPGTRVEAYVGSTRCGVASLRYTGNFSGYTIAVVGPRSVAGCERGEAITFRVDGREVADTARNTPGNDGTLDLSSR
jgi:hypothetical protein